MTSSHRPSASPRRSEQITSPTSPTGRNNRRSFSFTRNQDIAEESAGSHITESPSSLISKFRASTLTTSSTSSDKIEEEEDDDDRESGPSLVPKTRFAPGVALGNGTGVSEPAKSSGKGAPSGLPLVPSLQPAGGNQRQVKPDNVASAGALYGDSSAIGDNSEDSDARGTNRSRGIVRTYSMAQQTRRPQIMNDDRIIRQRRLSHDALTESPRRFIVDVEETMRIVLEQEDTDGNFQICITDSGPKVLSLGTATSEGYKGFDIRGTYMLSNLLQELALAREHGRKRIVLDESRLTENPVDRLSRMISQTFWHNLTRRIDADGLEAILSDPKNRSKSKNPRIYVPAAETEMIEYYRRVASERPSLNLSVEVLPSKITAEYTRDLNDRPGLLALAMSKEKDPKTGEDTLRGIPFVVPGARFNELYNWDSYFISLGLVVDGWVDMTKGIVEHFIFNIKHYGKVLNGNRSYYLMRSQPPFLTDMALQVYSRLDPEKEEENKKWLRRAIQAAIKEYHTVWNAEPRRDPKTGLSRYRPEGLGVPPETEASHFTHILRPYADKYGVSVNEFTRMYNHREVDEPNLDEYFMHDRAVRESGHDTTYRFEKRCANLATIDLNSLMYKYEVDIATAIRELFDDELELEDDFLLMADMPPNYAKEQPPKPSRSIDTPQKSAEWFARAAFRKEQVDKYCWNEGMSLYYDYDTVKEEQSVYESVTAFWAMWAGLASEDQAARLVRNSLRKFEEAGGLVSCTRESVGKISLDRPNRQWDWPLGWAPHQILAWVGLERYGYSAEAARLAYRWLYQMTVTFVDYNGMVIEKIDVVQGDPFVEAEYGQQGIDFHYIPKEGFGWSNASYQIGLTFLTDPTMRRSLGLLQPPTEHFFRKSTPGKMVK